MVAHRAELRGKRKRRTAGFGAVKQTFTRRMIGDVSSAKSEWQLSPATVVQAQLGFSSNRW